MRLWSLYGLIAICDTSSQHDNILRKDCIYWERDDTILTQMWMQRPIFLTYAFLNFLEELFWTLGCVIRVTEYPFLGVTKYPLRSNGISPLRGNSLSHTEDISYPLPVTYHIPMYWNTIFKIVSIAIWVNLLLRQTFLNQLQSTFNGGCLSF